MTLTYNELPSVEHAAKQLARRPEFAQFLDEFAGLAYGAGISQFVGAFLLHRHFHLATEEDICEQHVSVEGISALVSAPTSGKQEDQLPHRWALTHGAWLPLEFSNDSAVRRHLPQLLDFMHGFGDLLLRYGLTECLGLALTARDALRPSPNQVYFEETTAMASIVTCVEDSSNIDAFINTLWVPDPTDPQMRCHQWQRCRREGSPPNDRHSYLMGHDRETE